MFPLVLVLSGLAFVHAAQAPAVQPSSPPRSSPSPTPTAADLKIPQALFDRVSAWWKARAARDHKAMYDLMDPRYRKATPYADFQTENTRRMRFVNLGFRIDKARVVAEGMRITVTAQMNLERFGLRDTPSEDLWVLADGQWFRVWEPAELPFPKSSPGSQSSAHSR